MQLTLLILLIFGHGALTNPVQPISSTNFLSELMGAFKGPMNVTRLMSTFQMPSCFATCIPHMEDMFKVIKKGNNDPVAVSKLCSELQESARCAVNAGCSTIFVETAAKLFQFVCLENIESVGDSLECIKNASEDLQPECESYCKLQSRFIDQASAANQINEVFDVKNMCNSTMCLMHCFKDRLGKKCVGQTNLVDTLISSMMKGEDQGFEEMLDWIVPEACKDENFAFAFPNDPTSSGPLSVMSTVKEQVKYNVETIPSTNEDILINNEIRTINRMESVSTEPIEAALLIDGELRTLQCSMFDWQRNPMPTPDFESLAKIMAAHVLPYKLADSENPKVKLPDDSDELDAEARFERRENYARVEADEENDEEQRRHVMDVLDSPVSTAGYASLISGLLVFAISASALF